MQLAAGEYQRMIRLPNHDPANQLMSHLPPAKLKSRATKPGAERSRRPKQSDGRHPSRQVKTPYSLTAHASAASPLDVGGRWPEGPTSGAHGALPRAPAVI